MLVYSENNLHTHFRYTIIITEKTAGVRLSKIKKEISIMIKHITKDIQKQEILTKAFSFILFRGGGLLTGYLFTFLITNHYGATVWGLMVLSLTLFLFVGIFGRLGVDINIVKHYSKEIDITYNSGLFYSVLLKTIIVSTVIAIILFLSKDFLSFHLFKKPNLEPYIAWVAMAIPFWSIVLICGGLQRSKGSNNWYAFLDNPGRFLFSLLFLIIFISLENNPLNAIKAHFFGVVLLAIIAILKTRKTFKHHTFKTNEDSKKFLKDSFPIMISSSVLIILGGLDSIILGLYEHEESIAIYNVALKISLLTLLSSQAINSILAPKIAKFYYQKKITELKKIIKFSTQINFLISLVVIAVILIFNKFLLGLFGGEFIKGKTVLIILCAGQLINAMSGSVGVILQMIGKQKTHQNIILLALLINIVLNFTLVPVYGSTGAAIATAISLSSWNIMGAAILKINKNITSYISI